MVRASDCLGVGWQALRAHTGRSLLTTLGIVVGVAAVICTMSIGAGAEDEVAERLRSLGANLLIVTPGAASPGGVRTEAGLRRNLDRRPTPPLSAGKFPASRAPRRSSRGDCRSSRETAIGRLSLLASPPPILPGREWSAEEGRLFETTDFESGAKVAIVGSDVADALFEGRTAVGEPIRIGAVPATVIAVLARKGVGAAGRSQDDVVFVPLPMARTRLLGDANGPKRNALDLISVKFADPALLPDAESQIETLLRRRHRLLGDAPNDFVGRESRRCSRSARRRCAGARLAPLRFGLGVARCWGDQPYEHHAGFGRRKNARIRRQDGGRRKPARSRPADACRDHSFGARRRIRRVLARDRRVARNRLSKPGGAFRFRLSPFSWLGVWPAPLVSSSASIQHIEPRAWTPLRPCEQTRPGSIPRGPRRFFLILDLYECSFRSRSRLSVATTRGSSSRP